MRNQQSHFFSFLVQPASWLEPPQSKNTKFLSPRWLQNHGLVMPHRTATCTMFTSVQHARWLLTLPLFTLNFPSQRNFVHLHSFSRLPILAFPLYFFFFFSQLPSCVSCCCLALLCLRCLHPPHIALFTLTFFDHQQQPFFPCCRPKRRFSCPCGRSLIKP